MAQNKFKTKFNGKKLRISLVIPNQGYANAIVEYLKHIQPIFKFVNENLIKSQFSFELNKYFEYRTKTIEGELILQIDTNVLLQDTELVLMGKKAFIADKYCICNVENLEKSFFNSNVYENCSKILS